ncbi:MAG TPA: carbamoyltransferase [Bacteriovoracaceae bacterium]|nr:carbamoyltransferase [Bacteriovoracaceae bacterium]
MSYVLGISCYYHDSAAVLIKDGHILRAVQEERFTRKKHDASFPIRSIEFLVNSFNLSLKDISAVVYYEKPFITFERLIETHLNAAPLGFKPFLASVPIWLKEKLFLERDITSKLKSLKGSVPPIKYSEHHLSHAASAFYPSPFDKAAVLCVDGVGEWATTSGWIGEGKNLRPLWEIHFPHSLGLLYSSITAYLGFKVNSGEYKVMGLAPYGVPRFKELMLKELIELHEDGSYSLNMKYFAYDRKLRMFNSSLERLLGQKAREPEAKLEQFHMDVAASLQETLETALIHLVKSLHHQTGLRKLCLAGGVALNCVANSKLFHTTGFEQIWVQPSAGDAGGALGAALAYTHLELEVEREVSDMDSQKGSYLGPAFSNEEIEEFLTSQGLPFEKLDEEQMIERTCELLEDKKIIGWFQGSMEFGPRALGHRSIIADARIHDLQRTMNLKVKYRESFRPFAPIVLKEDAKSIFDFEHESPYMLFVAPVREELRVNEDEPHKFGIERLNLVRSIYPAITHVDYSARLQTVCEKRNAILFKLLNTFKKRNSSSVLVNTSFNVRGEPIVCTPEDAYRCFRRTEIDVLVLGNYLISKDMKLPEMKDHEWRNEFELD